MGNPSSTEHRSPKTHRNTHNGDSRSAIVVRWWCYLRKLLMAVHPHSGTALPRPARSPPCSCPAHPCSTTLASRCAAQYKMATHLNLNRRRQLLKSLRNLSFSHSPAPSVGHSFAYLAWNKKAFKRHFVSFASSSGSGNGKNWNDKCFGFCDFVYCSNFAQKKKKWRKIVQILPHV